MQGGVGGLEHLREHSSQGSGGGISRVFAATANSPVEILACEADSGGCEAPFVFTPSIDTVGLCSEARFPLLASAVTLSAPWPVADVITTWHGFSQVWFPHTSAFPQGSLQENGAAALQATILCECAPRQGMDTGSWQGGQGNPSGDISCSRTFFCFLVWRRA